MGRMQRSWRAHFWVTTLLLAVPLSAAPAKSSKAKSAPKAEEAAASALPPVLWRDPGEIASLDLYYGPGGKSHAPQSNATYKFLKEDLNGTSTKFYVRDPAGVKWLVKVGKEARPETAATRLAWAMGYFADEDYYLPSMRVRGMPALKRPSDSVGADGTVTGARLKRQIPGQKKVANWSWFSNPFSDTRELNGLRVMMALLNNWDLLKANNKVYLEPGIERRFLVSDLGASFGKTGGTRARSKGVLKDYRKAKFIERAGADSVDFVMATKLFPLLAVATPGDYDRRKQMEGICKDIPRADVQWLSNRLSQLTPQQIRDAFRAAGYTPDEVEGYAQAVEARIAALRGL